MDDDSQDFAELEAELKRLRPAAPSRELRAQLERDLAAPRRGISAWWLLAALPAAAVLAIIVTLNSRRPSAPPGPALTSVPGFKPVSADNVLFDSRDEGYTTLADGTPARRVRQSYVDTITWKNPSTNASLRWSVPRSEVRVVPVVFQ